MTSGSDWKLGARDGRDTWTTPQRVNQDGPWNDHPEYYDQWMPRIAVDDQDRVHVIWYDTRNDPNSRDLDPPFFEIETFYAWAPDTNPDGSADLPFTESSLRVAIYAGDLVRGNFIADYNGLAAAGDLVVPVYMGTESIGFIEAPEADEAILSNLIVYQP